MARHLIHYFNCINDSASSYNDDDFIDVYYNDSTDVIEVDVNDVPQTSGGPIYGYEVQNLHYYTLRQTGYSFCSGDNLVSFSISESFPYASKIQVFSESCAATVCDLEKDGNVQITKASGSNAGDGSITVSATSSNTPIEYLLGSGRPRSTPTFNNLFPGTYTVHARDAAGCQITWKDILVGFSAIANYGILQYWNYFDKTGIEWKVELLQKDYSGSATQRDLLDGTPTIRSLRADNSSRLVSIIPGEFQLNVISESDREYLTLFADSDDEEFLIKQYRKPGASFELVWQGFATTELYTEPYEKPTKYVSTITATDRLVDLKTIDFTDEGGNEIYGRLSVFEALRLCLSKTNLELDFRVAMSLFEKNQNQTATDDPLIQTFIDPTIYYRNGEPENCYNVLTSILRSIFCDVMSYGGYWYIRYKPDAFATYNYREFDNAGNFVTNGSIEPIIDFKSVELTNRAVWLAGGKSLEGDDVYKTININSIRNIKGSIFPEFNERNIDGDTFVGWSKVLNGESGSIVPVKLGEILVFGTLSQEIGSTTGLLFGNNLSAVVRGGGRRRGSHRTGGEGSLIKLDRHFFEFRITDNQGGQAYIVSSGLIEFGPNDDFILKIPVLMDISGDTPPYMKAKYALRIGSKYLQSDGTWDTPATVNEFFLDDYNTEVTLDLSGKFDSVTTTTNTTFQIQIYDVDPFEYDLEGSSLLNIIQNLPDPDNYELGNRLITRITDSRFYFYYEIGRDSSGDNEWQAVTSAVLELPDSRLINENRYSKYYVGSIEFITRPGGERIEEIETIALQSAAGNKKILDYDINHFDLNTDLNNTEKLLDNYFTLSDGTPTQQWGDSEKKIQKVIGDQIARFYNKMAFRLTGGFSVDIHVNSFNVFRETSDSNRLYMPVFMSIDDRRKKVNVELIEINNDDSKKVSAFTTGFEQDAVN